VGHRDPLLVFVLELRTSSSFPLASPSSFAGKPPPLDLSVMDGVASALPPPPFLSQGVRRGRGSHNPHGRVFDQK
jgi:hypothetical protein